MSDFDLLGCCTPTATLDSEIHPTVKGRRTSLSIFSLISSSNTDAEKDKDAEKDTDAEKAVVVEMQNLGVDLVCYNRR